ncbi:MAG: hypothetical protein H5T59_08475 [Anaerolineae bacterium]|nr:hypothetical protein [Anaerolineae bacterium]
MRASDAEAKTEARAGVVRDIPVQVDLEELLRVSRDAGAQPAVRAAAEWAAARAVELAEPAGVYRWLPVERAEADSLHLEGGHVLHIGEKAHLLQPAKEVLAFAETIGPRLEEEVRACFQEGRALEGYLLDCAGVLALASAGDYFRRMAEEEAARRGWGVSLFTAPGSLVGWPLQGQRELCPLLDLEAIGVTLSPSCVLWPGKSASGLIGIGPGFRARKVGSPCRFCQIADTCWRRRA